MNCDLPTGLRVLLRIVFLPVLVLTVLQVWRPSLRGEAPQNGIAPEDLHDVVSRQRLNPPLRSGVANLRYSPDGRYLLVQDTVGIYVIAREPLKLLGHVAAPDSYRAVFSEDSKSISIVSLGLQYQRWAVVDGRRLETKDLSIKEGCVNAELSPQGGLLACFRPDFSLGVFRTPEDQLIFSNQSRVSDRPPIFPIPLGSDTAFAGPFGYLLAHDFKALANRGVFKLPMAFSEDGLQLVVGGVREGGRFDLQAKKRINLPGAIEKNLDAAFVVQGKDRLIVKPRDPAIFSLANGQLITKPGYKADGIHLASNSRYVLLYDAGLRGVRIFDLEENRSVEVPENVGADVFGQEVAVLTEDGILEVHRLGERKPVVAGQMPLSELPMLRCASVAPELDQLVLSIDGEGALYQLSTGQRLLTYPRFSAANAEDGTEFVLMPAYPKPQSVLRLDPKTLKFLPVWTTDKAPVRAGGAALLEYSFQDYMGNGVMTVNGRDIPYRLRALDPATGKELWGRSFASDVPVPFSDPQGDRAVLAWPAKSEGARTAAKHVEVIKEKFRKAKLTDHDSFLEALDARNGKSMGGVLVQTGAGPANFESVFSTGDTIIFTRDEVRVYLYSLKDGELKARLVGARPAASAGSRLLALIVGPGRLEIRDLASGAKLDEQRFPDTIAYTHFSNDGSKLFVLTEHQYVFTIDMKGVRERPNPKGQGPEQEPN